MGSDDEDDVAFMTGAAATADHQRRAALPSELLAKLRAQVENKEQCVHCGGLHSRACPRIKMIRFHPDGALLEVRFWRDGRWPTENVFWPEDLYDDEPDPEV